MWEKCSRPGKMKSTDTWQDFPRLSVLISLVTTENPHGDRLCALASPDSNPAGGGAGLASSPQFSK